MCRRADHRPHVAYKLEYQLIRFVDASPASPPSDRLTTFCRAHSAKRPHRRTLPAKRSCDSRESALKVYAEYIATE